MLQADGSMLTKALPFDEDNEMAVDVSVDRGRADDCNAYVSDSRSRSTLSYSISIA